MSTSELLVVVPPEDQLPSTPMRFGGGAGGAYLQGSNGVSIANINHYDFVEIVDCRQATTSGTQWLFNDYNGGSNYRGFCRNTSLNFSHRYVTGGTHRLDNANSGLNLTIPPAYGPNQRFLLYRQGNTWGIAAALSGDRSTPELVKVEITLDTSTAGLNYGTSVAAGNKQIGHFNGSTNANKWNGWFGFYYQAICTTGSLSSHGLGTDEAKLKLLLDPQRLRSVHGFTDAQLTCFGDLYNSDDSPKIVLASEQFTAGQKLVCPFSSKVLTLMAGAATATELILPRYDISAHYSNIAQGSLRYLESENFNILPDRTVIASRVHLDNLTNPHFFLDFVDAERGVYRQPYQVLSAKRYTDSSAGNAVKPFLNYALADLGIDRHGAVVSRVLYEADGVTPKAVVSTNFGHSVTTPNHPDTGDTTYDDVPFIVQTDALPQIINVGNTPKSLTYSWMLNRGNQLYAHQRINSNTAARLRLAELDHTSMGALTGREWEMIGQDNTTIRNYGGPIVLMSDGRMAVFHYAAAPADGTVDNGLILTPPTAAEMATNSKWFTRSGKNLGGSDGVPALGSITMLNNFADLSIQSSKYFYSGTFTANASTDLLNTSISTTTNLSQYERVRVRSGGTLPSPLVAGTTYYVIKVNTFEVRLATSLANAQSNNYIDITSAGSGAHTMYLVTDHVRMEMPSHITGMREGFAMLMRRSADNGDLLNIINGTPAGGATPFETTHLKRMRYTPGTSPLVEDWDETDITEIVETQLEGDWPLNTDGLKSECVYLTAMQTGPNEMLVLFNDPLEAPPAEKITGYLTGLTGFRLTGVLFHRLASSNPTDHYVLPDPIFELPTDFSEGYGFLAHPALDHKGYCTGIGCRVMGGQYTSAGSGMGNQIPVFVDIRDQLRAARQAVAPKTQSIFMS